MSQLRDKEDSSFTKKLEILKLGIKKASFDDLQKRMTRNINTLQSFTEMSIAAEPVKSRRRGRTPNFKLLRDCAKAIYSVIEASLRCSCANPHIIGLRLDALNTRAVCRIEDEDEDVILSKLNFRILLSYAQDANILQSAPWTFEEADIRSLTTPYPSAHPSPALQPVTMRKKGVRFSDVEDLSMKLTAISLQADSLLTIEDLCKTIELHKMANTVCLGVLKDKITHRTHGLYPIRALVNEKHAWSTIVLDDILTGKLGNTKSRLRDYERRKLALALASSVLQLYQTPWLNDDLQTSEITFLQRPGVSPFQSAFLTKPISAQAQSVSSAFNKMTMLIRNRTLFNLGILLIELCLQQKVDPSDLMRIDELIMEVEIKFGSRYESVVRRCIGCVFTYNSTDLSDERFSATVYTEVVSVLEDDVIDCSRDPF